MMDERGGEGGLSRAVILAAGRGTRMREPASDVQLSAEQREMAEAGMKAMMPVAGRPFLDYKLHALAEAGITAIVVVIGPDHDGIPRYYRDHPPERVKLEFIVQSEPLGSAHALLQAEPCCGGEPFAQVNSDNYYPASALQMLGRLDGCGLVAFRRDTLVIGGNMTAERTTNCAHVIADGQGRLLRLMEKPGRAYLDAQPLPVWLSMTCWRFEESIFEACRRTTPSPRGELEIPDAVQVAMDELGVPFTIAGSTETVLDLSRRSDIAVVEGLLAGVSPRP